LSSLHLLAKQVQRSLFQRVLVGREKDADWQWSAHTSNPYIANPEISKLLRIRRNQVYRFMDDVLEAYPEVEVVGKVRWTKYRLR
jgi:predicted DNA-binding transcriptional regulator AlpA